MALSPFPVAPSRADPTTFASRADATLGHLDTFVTELNSVIGTINITASAAQNGHLAALAAANFLGNWSDLSGNLNTPASVLHDGDIWFLTENVTSVQVREPGVHSAWSRVGTLIGAPVISTGTTIDCALGTYFVRTVASNTTFAFSNAPTGLAYAFTLRITHNSGAITWPSSVDWVDSQAPELTTGRDHLFFFVTENGGTSWRGASITGFVA